MVLTGDPLSALASNLNHHQKISCKNKSHKLILYQPLVNVIWHLSAQTRYSRVVKYIHFLLNVQSKKSLIGAVTALTNIETGSKIAVSERLFQEWSPCPKLECSRLGDSS